jgi:putative ABC transport system permease protein
VILGLVVGFGVTLGSAMLPAIHASRIHPMEALRESGTHSRKPLRRRTIVGAALTGAALAIIAIGLSAPVPSPMVFVAPGAILLILGATLLSAALLIPISSGLRGILSRLFGVPGRLAANNIHREPRRSANTASALMIGVMLLSLTATISASARDLMEQRVAGNVTADFYVSSSQVNLASGPVVGPASYDIVLNTPGVDDTARWGFGKARLDGVEYRVTVFDTAVADEVYVFDTDPSMERVGDGVFVGPALTEQGIRPGDVITLDGPRGDLDLVVTGEYLGTKDGELFIDWETGERLFWNIDIISLLVTVDQGEDPTEVRASLERRLSDFPLIKVYEPSDLTKMANDLVTMVLVLISALLSGALVIAVLGIANTLLLSVTERTREIGLLRAIGLGRRAVRRMIRLESVIIALVGAIMGIVLGTVLGASMMIALKNLGFTTLSIPWLLLGLYAIIAILAGLVAAALPARRAARLDILEAITTE